jgi:hypothetical protein
LGSSVWLSRSLRNGRPKSSRRVAVESLDTRAKSKPTRGCRYGSVDDIPRRTRTCEWW